MAAMSKAYLFIFFLCLPPTKNIYLKSLSLKNLVGFDLADFLHDML